MADKDKTLGKDWEAIEKKGETTENQDEELLVKEDGQQEKKLDYASHEELEAKLTEAEQTAHANWEKVVRAQAELENIRRRSRIDVENAHKYAIDKLAKELLPIIDSLESALETSVIDTEDEALRAVHQGVELTLKMILDAFAKFSITQLNPLGEAFDPNLHEAMSMQPDPEAKPGTVLLVIQKGYQLHDRLLRPARVIVAKSE